MFPSLDPFSKSVLNKVSTPLTDLKETLPEYYTPLIPENKFILNEYIYETGPNQSINGVPITNPKLAVKRSDLSLQYVENGKYTPLKGSLMQKTLEESSVIYKTKDKPKIDNTKKFMPQTKGVNDIIKDRKQITSSEAFLNTNDLTNLNGLKYNEPFLTQYGGWILFGGIVFVAFKYLKEDK